MNEQTINAIKTLLSRADLKGSEVPTYNACVKALDIELEKQKIEDTGIQHSED
jgi:hypothetical protein